MLGVVSGFLVSGSALAWLSSVNHSYHDLPSRIGFLSALICALGVLIFCYAASAAYLARKFDWSPRTCMKAGFPLLILGLLICVFDSRFWPVAVMICTNNLTAGFLCRRLAYPDMTDEQAAAPEPPIRLFRK